MKTLFLFIIIGFVMGTFSSVVSAQVAPVTKFETSYFKGNHGTYPIPYSITNGKIIGTPLDLPAKALLFIINATSDGELTVELPRTIIDSKNGTKDVPYYVAVDDIATLGGRPFPIQAQEINYDNLRIVKVNFTKTTKEIEIVGTYFIENYSSKMEHTPKPLSPLKQFKTGILTKDVICKDEYVLLTKTKNGSPACVKPDTAQKLMERGWAKGLGRDIVRYEPSDITKSKYKIDPKKEKLARQKQEILTETLAKETSNMTLKEREKILPWSSISYDYVDNALEVTILPEYFNAEALPKYFEKIRSIVGNEIDIVLSPQGYASLTDKQTSSALRLFLSTDSTYTNPAEAVGVDISLNNTSSKPLILAKSDNWPRSDLSSGSCSSLPFGIAILKGYYTEQNMTGASSLVIYPNLPCPRPSSIKSYTFEPLSSKATQECDGLFSCPGLADMKIHLKIDGFLDSNGQHRTFNVGTYTIVGGDEWGHVAIGHFTVAYATPLASSENNCGQFYTVPEKPYDFKTVPVLLMNSNSTGCARLTFTIIYKYDDMSNGAAWPRLANFAPLLYIGNYHYSTNGNTFGITPGKDFTNSFQITVIPQTVDLANYPIGSNFTVIYIIKPLPNATGFYDHSIPRLACERYPLAVGYAANQVNYSDFSYIYPLNPPCVSGPYSLTAVEISGMSYKQVTLGAYPSNR